MRNRGFSLLELVVVIVVVAFLAVIAIARLLAIQADAERVSMEMLLGTLRSAIGMKVAESIVNKEVPALANVAGTNPMDQLAELPHNYLGALDAPDPARLTDGNWYFDRRDGALVYLVRNTAHFSGGMAEPPRARFRIELVYTDRDGNGRYDAGTDGVQGLRLAAVEPYSWTRR